MEHKNIIIHFVYTSLSCALIAIRKVKRVLLIIMLLKSNTPCRSIECRECVQSNDMHTLGMFNHLLINNIVMLLACTMLLVYSLRVCIYWCMILKVRQV